MEEIIDGLRRFTRRTDDEPYQLTPVHAAIHDALELTGHQMRESRVSLRVDSRDEGLRAFCRPAEIVQVLVNLLTNAVEAARAGPERWVRLAAYPQGEHAVLEVSDSGPGIPPEIRAQIFQPFFTTRGTGTGLGLSISRKIAAQHGGDLTLVAGAAHTTFRLRLRAARTGAAAA
jgi:C4-dicarboxylate-specific signal transduction histidine kinase